LDIAASVAHNPLAKRKSLGKTELTPDGLWLGAITR